MKHQVEIIRIHKGSPYNCSHYIPEIIHHNKHEVINIPEVQNAINKTFGRKLIVNVSTDNDTTYLQYEIEKPKAIINNLN